MQGRTPPPVLRATRSQLRNVHICRSRGACAPGRGPDETVDHRTLPDPGSHHPRPHGRSRRSRTRSHRVGQDPRLWASFDCQGWHGHLSPSPGAGSGPDPGVGRADRSRACSLRPGQRQGGRDGLRRGRIRPPAQRDSQRGRRGGRNPGPTGRPHRRTHRLVG